VNISARQHVAAGADLARTRISVLSRPAHLRFRAESGHTKPGYDPPQSNAHGGCRRSRTALCNVRDLTVDVVSEARALLPIDGLGEFKSSVQFDRIFLFGG
jgi:hypothetical protein